MAVDVGSAVGYLDLDISGFLEGLKTAQSEAGKMGDNVTKQLSDKFASAGKTLTSAGKTLTTAVTAPVVGMGTAVVKASADFESAMSKVSAISGATGTELEELNKKAQEMGIKTKFSAKESADAFTYMAMAGWKTEDMLAGIDGIMSLAAADGLDLATTSDIVTDALTAFGMSADESAHFADVLAKASSSANTNVSMLGESFKYVAPVAGSLGYSAEDVAVALGLMANAGIKGSQGGTALRASLTRLIKPTDDAAALIEKYGLEITNTDGSMKSLSDVMDTLRKNLGGLTEAEQAQVAAAIFGQEAMSGMLAIINASESDYNNLTSAINNADGAAQQMAEIQLDNLSGQLTLLKSALEGIAIQLGEIVVPYVKDFVGWIQTLVQKFSELSPQQQEFIVKAVAIAAVIGPILLIFGKLTTGIGKMITAFGKISSLFGNFGSAATAVAGPAATAAKGVGSLAQSALGFVAAGAGIALAATGFALLTQSAIALSKEGWPAVAILGGMVVAVAGLAAGAAALGPALTAGAVGLVAFGGAVTLIGAGILAASAGISLLAEKLPIISEHGAEAAKNITLLGGAMTAFGAGILVASGGVATLGIGLLSVGAGATAAVVGVTALGVSMLVLATATASTAKSVNAIEDSASSAAASLEEMVTSVDVVETGLNSLESIANKAVSAFVSVFTSSTPKAGSTAKSMATAVTKNVKEGLAPIPNNTTETMNKMNSAVSSGMTKMNSTIRQGFANATSYIKSVANQSYSWGADVMQGLVNGIYSKMGSLKSAVNQAANVIYSNLHFSRPDEGPLRDYETWMPDFMQGLAKGIHDNSHLVKSAVQDVASDMKLDDVEDSKTELFTAGDAENLNAYNIILLNTVALYRQLAEQMQMCAQYSGIMSGDNNLLNPVIAKAETRVREKPETNEKNNEAKKPDTLTIPISIGEEQIENVVVDLLRREVRV